MPVQKIPFSIAVILFTFIFSGCSTIYNVAGRGVVAFGEQQLMPSFMASNDTEVVCAMGEGFSPAMMSFGEVMDEMVPMLTLASGLCASNKASQEKLRYLKAIRKNDAVEAQDARTMEKRYHALAAKRQYTGYQAIVRAYGEPGGECPALNDYHTQLNWMMGLLVGMQALMADVASEGSNNIPFDIAPKVLRGIQCLDSEKWWGVPEGVEALAMILLPTDIPANIDPYQKLTDAVEVGNSQGVRLVQMLEANLHSSKGDTENLKRVIREHVQTKKDNPGDPSLRFLDEMATEQILLLSDRLWVDNTGRRTPFGKLGTFWDDGQTQSSAMDIDELL